MSPLCAIEEALREQRYETARRLCLQGLKEGAIAKRAGLLLLHSACQKLGDFAACREALDKIPSATREEEREVLLLQAADFASYATDGQYRTSAEKQAGFSVDEFLEKYRALAEQCRAQAGPIPSPIPSTPMAETAIAEDLPPRFGALCGRLTFPDGSPAASVTVTLGLESPMENPDPRLIRATGLDYHPKIAPPRCLATRTGPDGRYEFAQVLAGRHEFLAVTLDPSQHDLATHFVRQGVLVRASETATEDAVISEWQSAEPAPNPVIVKEISYEGAVWQQLDSLPMRNPFAYDFPRQLIEWKTPHADRRDAALFDAAGQPVPFQRDGGTILFFTTLAGQSEQAYGWYAGEAKVPGQPPLPLRLEPEGATATIHTGRASYRIPWGGALLPPLLAVRGTDAVWRGIGRWALPTGLDVQTTTTSILEEGPLRMRVAVTTTFSNGAEHRLLLTAYAGEPCLNVRETSPDLEGAAFEFSLAEFLGGRGFLHWAPEKNNSRHWSSLNPEDRELARLQESVPWWIPPAGFGFAVTPDSLLEKDYIAVVTLRRGEWIDRKFAALAAGPGNDPAWHRELDWPYPEMVGSTISMITAQTRSNGDVVFRFGLFDGERQWGLLASDFDRNDGPDKEIAAVQHKNSSPRLTDFLRWRLDARDSTSRPHVLACRDQLAHIRRKVRHPGFAKHLALLQQPSPKFAADGLRFHLENDPAIAWRRKMELLALAPVRARMTLLGRDAGDLYGPVGGRPITHYAEDYDLLAPSGVFTAEEERFIRAFFLLMGHMFLEPDMMNWHFNSRNANFEADRVDIVGTIGMTFLGNPDADAFTRHAAELMERSLEVYCTPSSGKWYENPACYYLHAGKCRLNIAYHLATHGLLDPSALPRLKEFLNWGILLLTPRQPESYDVMRDGVPAASYPHLKKIRRIAPIGDHAVLGKYILDHCALLASYYRDSDPVFADLLLWAYRETGSSGGYFGAPALVLARMESKDVERDVPAPLLTSRRLEGFGAVFRGNFGRDEEFYLLFKQGPGGYRYHRTEGSILLFADGKPLVYDGGEGGETWRHSTLSFFESHLPLAPGHVERFFTSSAMDFCQGVHPDVIHPGEPVFLSDDCHHHLVPKAFARYHEPHPANIRTVAWVKNDYVVLHDSLALDPAIPRHWHLQVVADREIGTIEDGFVFAGRFGTDLQVLLPGPVPEETEITTVPLHEYHTDVSTRFAMRHLRVRREAATFYAAVLRPLAAGASRVRAEILAGGDHLRVMGDAGVDDLFFSREIQTFALRDGRFCGRYGSVLRRAGRDTVTIVGGGTATLRDVEVTTDVSLAATIGCAAIHLEAAGHGTLTVKWDGHSQTLLVQGILKTDINRP